MKLGLVAYALSAVATVALASGAHAAPTQILGLVATSEPTQLNCVDGVCSAEFSSFCLQKFRPSPESGTAYRLGENADLTLYLTDATGAARALNAADLVSVDSERMYAAVRISVPESALGRSPITKVALKVGEAVTLIPETTGDADDPISDAEITAYSGPLRLQADQLYDNASESAVAAETSLKLLNAHHRQNSPARVDIEALWRDAIGDAAADNSPVGIQRVSRALKECGETQRIFDLCLESIHENAISESNSRVWKYLGTGS